MRNFFQNLYHFWASLQAKRERILKWWTRQLKNKMEQHRELKSVRNFQQIRSRFEEVEEIPKEESETDFVVRDMNERSASTSSAKETPPQILPKPLFIPKSKFSQSSLKSNESLDEVASNNEKYKVNHKYFPKNLQFFLFIKKLLNFRRRKVARKKVIQMSHHRQRQIFRT